MLLPEIVHLPAVMLLVMIAASGVALPVALPFSASMDRSSFGQWATVFGVLFGTASATLITWFGFRASCRSLPTDRFLGFSNRIWSVAIPLTYFTGVAFGVYLYVLFYA